MRGSHPFGLEPVRQLGGSVRYVRSHFCADRQLLHNAKHLCAILPIRYCYSTIKSSTLQRMIPVFSVHFVDSAKNLPHLRQKAGERDSSPAPPLCDRASAPVPTRTARCNRACEYDRKTLKGRRYICVRAKEKILKPKVSGLSGGDKRDRTADLLNAIQALS